MKTWQAILAHIGLTVLQSAAAVQFFDTSKPKGALANAGVQVGIQAALTALQGLAAYKNSTTDPEGQPLAPSAAGGFVTSTK